LSLILETRKAESIVKIGNTKGNEESKAEESSSSSSAGSPPSEQLRSVSASPFIDGVSRSDSFVRDNHHFLETADLHPAPSTLITNDQGGDYPPAIGFGDAKYICLLESSKLWAIAGPIAFNILCNYGVNSFTNIFVGHIGDIELSAVAISLSVIANFSFGFLVSFPRILLLFSSSYLLLKQ
jgi:MATE family multidrug resistance protein